MLGEISLVACRRQASAESADAMRGAQQVSAESADTMRHFHYLLTFIVSFNCQDYAICGWDDDNTDGICRKAETPFPQVRLRADQRRQRQQHDNITKEDRIGEIQRGRKPSTPHLFQAEDPCGGGLPGGALEPLSRADDHACQGVESPGGKA